MTDHPDLLRRAADRIREAANALPDHHNTRWEPITLKPNERFGDYAWWVRTDIHTPALDGTRSDTTIAECGWSGADADHIALWHPGVALAVAAWLESEATSLEHHLPAWDGTRWRERNHPEEPAPRGYRNPGHVAALVEHHYCHPLAVARALLGEGA